MRLILASSSPRRKEILSLLGLPFDVVSPGIEEIFQKGRLPADEARYWAVEKARTVYCNYSDAFVIGSDTIIDLEGRTIGKPIDPDDAVRILALLTGRAHTVVTAVALVLPDGSEHVAVEKTIVRMRSVSKGVLSGYVASGEPMDKAGAYSLQGEGRQLIDSIEGDFLAAVGLPLRAAAGLLRGAGIKYPTDVESIYHARSVMNWQSYKT
jgi:septum formation protein